MLQRQNSPWILIPFILLIIVLLLYQNKQTITCKPNIGCTYEESSIVNGVMDSKSFKQADIATYRIERHHFYGAASHRHFTYYTPTLIMKDNSQIEFSEFEFKFYKNAEIFVNQIIQNKKVKKSTPNIIIKTIINLLKN